MSTHLSKTICIAAGAAIFLLAIGCGSSMQLQPLAGEEADQLAMLNTTAEELTVDAPTFAAKTLLHALETRDDANAWNMLSTRTQEALTKKYATEQHSTKNMLKVIRKQLSLEGSQSIAQLLFGTQPKSLKSYGPDQEATPHSGRAPSKQATIYAYGHNGQVAQVHFVLKNHQWFLDTTRF